MLDAILLVDVTVHGQQKAFFPGPLKDRSKLAWWIVSLIRVKTDTYNPIFIGKGFHECSHGVASVHIPKNAQNKRGRDAQFTLRPHDGLPVPSDDSRK